MSSVSDCIRLGSYVFVAAIVTKFAKCAKVLAQLWVPLVAAFWGTLFCLAHFNNMVFPALLTEFAKSCLEVFAWNCLHFPLMYIRGCWCLLVLRRFWKKELEAARITFWASTCCQSSQARVTSAKFFSFHRKPTDLRCYSICILWIMQRMLFHCLKQ